jgi:hypothetical protein
MFLGLPDPDPLDRGTDQAPGPHQYVTYLLLVAMSPFLHVEGSRTRLGAVALLLCQVHLSLHSGFPP